MGGCLSTATRPWEPLPDDNKTFEPYEPADDNITRKLKQSVLSENWQTLRDEWSAVEKDETISPDDRWYYLNILGNEITKMWPGPDDRSQDLESFGKVLDEWFKNEPEKCIMLRAYFCTRWAWHVSNEAKRVTLEDHQIGVFANRLIAASKEVEVARAKCPSDPLIYVLAIWIKLGLGDVVPGIMSVESCLDSLVNTAHEPLLYQAHSMALQYYGKKWHGSNETMLSYARSVAHYTKLPNSHPLWILIPTAHLECSISNLYNNNTTEWKGGQLGYYWHQPQVVGDIMNSFEHALPGEAASMIQATNVPDHYREWYLRNCYAYCFDMIGVEEEARRQIRIIGKRPVIRSPIWESIDEYKQDLRELGFSF